ncbi:MAG: DUF5615 family PIN-like protein [Methylobacterium mesophilicum]|nr:DUF5615 family PIN-like protein [Methylobacterium mesophilicum]
MRFVIDENLSPALARSLQALFPYHEVIHIRDRFGLGKQDLDWIPELSADDNWIVISGDRRIAKNEFEKRAFRASRLIAFFMCRTVYEKDVRRQMIRLLTIWPEIEAQVRLVQPGAMFEIAEKSSRFRAL